MSRQPTLPRRALPHALAIALLGLALTASAVRAESSDLRSRMPTSSLAGTSVNQGSKPYPTAAGSHARTPSDITSALAQERYYSSYGAPRPLVPPATDADDGDGIAPLLFVLAMAAALVIGIAAGSGLHTLQLRRRRAAGLAT